MNELEPPDSFHLRAAIGWIELGNCLEANEELENISPSMRVHPDVLNLRWHICAKAKNNDLNTFVSCYGFTKWLVPKSGANNSTLFRDVH